MNVRWTPQHTERLRQFCAEAKSTEYISRTLGFNLATICRHRRALGLLSHNQQHKWLPQHTEQLRRLTAERKWTVKEIANMMGFRERTVCRYRKEHGLMGAPSVKDGGGRRWTPDEIDTLRKLCAEMKWSDIDLGYMLNRHPRVVHRKRNEIGMPPASKGGAQFGHTHSAEVRAKLSIKGKARWQDPEYRARGLAALKRTTEASLAKRFRRPPRNTPEYHAYRKLCDCLGAERAHEEWLKSYPQDAA